MADPWLPSPGPASVYEAADFERAAGDDRYPVFRRELSGETDAAAWSGLLRRADPADEDGRRLTVPWLGQFVTARVTSLGGDWAVRSSGSARIIWTRLEVPTNR